MHRVTTVHLSPVAEGAPAIPAVLPLLARPVVWVSVLCWLALALFLWRPLADRSGWARRPTLGALLSAAVVGVVTLTPDGWFRLRDPHTCLDLTPGAFAYAGSHLFAGPQELANVLLVVPLGFCLVLASRQVTAPAVAVLVLPIFVELLQAAFVQRVCTVLDWFDNTVGGLIGVAAGVVLLAVRARAEAADRPG